MAAFAAVACAASPAAAAGAAAGAPGAPRFRALVHVDDMDAEVVPDARDGTGDADLHARDVTDEKTRHAEARVAHEHALADIEERLYGTLRLFPQGGDTLRDTLRDTRDTTHTGVYDALSDDATDARESRDDVASAFRELFAFVADAPSPARARAEARDAARRRAARTRNLEGLEGLEGLALDSDRASDLETSSMLARVADEALASALRDARAPLVEYFGEDVVDAETPVTLEPADGGSRFDVSVVFGFKDVDVLVTEVEFPESSISSSAAARPEGDLKVASEKGARLLEALASVDTHAPRQEEEAPIGSVPIGSATQKEKAARALSRAVEAAAAAAAARDAAVAARKQTRGEDGDVRAPERSERSERSETSETMEPLVASLEDLPAEWRAVADALYLLASLVELGVAPKTRDAYPPPRILPRLDTDTHREASHSTSHSASHGRASPRRFRATSDGRWADVHFADDPSIEVTSVPALHPALAEPQKWAAAAVFAAAEMGSRDARLAAGDRVLRGRGAAFEDFFEDEDADEDDVDFEISKYPDIGDFACERATRVYLLPAAERAADAAEAAGDVRVPPEPPRLRARERDAGYVDYPHAEEDGDAQIEMERDMAARGVPEAERHLGYRALMGRGVARDEGDALARFRAAADLGDPLAMFNLGYMHMHGVGTGVNHTEARALFEKAASLDVAAAHNGVGVLDYNGWATGDGAPDLAAARARFEAGAAAGDPDASFNLGTLYQAGAGGLPLDHAEAYARYQAASDAGHWRAPLAVAKLTLEGWDPSAAADGGGGGDGDGESTRPARVRLETSETSHPDEASHEERGRVVKNCREAARLLAAFLEERLAVFSDEHEDALAALEGGFVEAEAAESRAGAASDSENVKNEETSEVEVGPDPWGALVRYALIAERGSEAGLANAAFLAKKAGSIAAKTRWNVRGGWEKEKGEKSEKAFPPHLTRRAARDAARLALTRLAAAGDVEARVDLGDVEWAAAVEGDDDTNETNDALNPNRQKKRKASHPRPPSAPAPAPDASSPPPPPPAPPREGGVFAGGARHTRAGSSETSETTFLAHVITLFFSPLFPESSVPEHESGLERDAKPPAPAAPPREFARTRRVAFHYQEASLLGLPEGSVSLAWCWSRGVGVPRRDLKQAELALWKAHDDSEDEMEAFAPLAAAAAVAAVNAAAAVARIAKGAFSLCSFSAAAPSDAMDAVDLVRRLDLAFGAKETNAVLYPGSVPGTGTSPGTSPGTTSDAPTRNARGARARDARAAAAEKNGDAKKKTRFFLRVEGCVLAVLVCGFAAIGYARFIALVGEHRDARAAFLVGLSPATVAGVAGAVAAAAWAAAA